VTAKILIFLNSQVRILLIPPEFKHNFQRC